MKHPWAITLSLSLLFLAAQFIGLAIINKYLHTDESGIVHWGDIPSVAGLSIERPQLTSAQTILYIVGAIILGSLLILIIIRFRSMFIWKIWFAFAISLCLYIAFAAFLQPRLALVLALLLGITKTIYPNRYVHNITELFTYGGLAALFSPLLTTLAAFLLLLVLSIYDVYAVFASKHMIKLAKFQTESGVFAGLLIPYHKTTNLSHAHKTKKQSIAVLGGGDIGFPLLFSGAVLAAAGLLPALIVSLGAAAGLLILLLIGHQGKFYPAIPFLTAGALAGYLITFLL